MTDIKQALTRLDPADDSQWTGDGLPKLEVVERMAGLKGVKRQMVTEADPEFTRETAAARLREAMEVAESEQEAQGDDPGADEPEDEFLEAEQRLSKARDAHRLATAELANAQRAMDVLIMERERARPRQEATASIQHYLNRQREMRADRVRRLQAAPNPNPEGRAQIDQAMGRKSGHGLNRPQRPPVAGAE